MPKLFYLLLILPLFSSTQPQVSYSPQFEEPESGRYEFLPLKNANTAFLNISNKGIEVRIFDAITIKGYKFNIEDTGLYPGKLDDESV